MTLEITFRHMEPSPAMQERIQELAARLEHFSSHIMRCHVSVQAPHAHHHQGRLFEVGIDISVPDKNISVRRAHPYSHAHEDPYVALRDAFHAARRQLEDYEREHGGM